MQLSEDGKSIDDSATNTRNEDFYNYYGYDLLIANGTYVDSSPLNFNPTNCQLENSWVLPKV